MAVVQGHSVSPVGALPLWVQAGGPQPSHGVSVAETGCTLTDSSLWSLWRASSNRNVEEKTVEIPENNYWGSLLGMK